MNPLFKLFVHAHTWAYKASGGKVGRRMGGADVLLLTTKGRKSGLLRTVPVMCFSDAGERVVVASMGGQPEHPAWFHNLKSDPDVTVHDGADTYAAKAVITEGEERQRLYDMVAKQMPQFAGYQKKTTRVIPVVRLVRKG